MASETNEYPTKILVVGAPGAGKTSICRRLVNEEFDDTYSPTNRFEVYSKRFSTSKGINVPIEIYDFSGKFVEDVEFESFPDLFKDVWSVLIVFDLSDLNSVSSVNDWIYLLREWIPFTIPRVILAHKADKRWVIQPQILDSYITDGHIVDWFLTVGHPQFGDYDSRRGSGAKQRTPTDVLNLLFRRLPRIDFIEPEKDNIYIPHSEMIPILPLKILTDFDIDKKDFLKNDDFDINDGWEFYGGVMTREESEGILNSHVTHFDTFLIRQSDLNNQFRVVIRKGFDGSISHVPLKEENNSYRVGRPQLRGIVFSSLMEALLALELHPSNGIKFERSVWPLKYKVLTS